MKPVLTFSNISVIRFAGQWCPFGNKNSGQRNAADFAASCTLQAFADFERTILIENEEMKKWITKILEQFKNGIVDIIFFNEMYHSQFNSPLSQRILNRISYRTNSLSQDFFIFTVVTHLLLEKKTLWLWVSVPLSFWGRGSCSCWIIQMDSFHSYYFFYVN